jgi:nucleoside-diphosphate-sugar epimerase
VQRLLSFEKDSGKGLLFCSGTGVLSCRTGGEWSHVSVSDYDDFEPLRQLAGRVALENEVKAAGVLGVRGIVVRPPAVWTDERPHMLVTKVIDSVRETGSACYIGRGLNLYSHVHAADLGRVFVGAAERGQAGATYHATAGEVPNRWIAETVARRFGVPSRSITMDEAIELWGKFYALVVGGVSSRSRSERSRTELHWEPRRVDMLASAETWMDNLCSLNA